MKRNDNLGKRGFKKKRPEQHLYKGWASFIVDTEHLYAYASRTESGAVRIITYFQTHAQMR